MIYNSFHQLLIIFFIFISSCHSNIILHHKQFISRNLYSDFHFSLTNSITPTSMLFFLNIYSDSSLTFSGISFKSYKSHFTIKFFHVLNDVLNCKSSWFVKFIFCFAEYNLYFHLDLT